MTGRPGFCQEHQRRIWNAENDKHRERKRIYNSSQWKKLRAVILARSPTCVLCAQRGELVPATVVDHIHRIEAGGSPFDESNLQSLCDLCHQRKRGREAHQ